MPLCPEWDARLARAMDRRITCGFNDTLASDAARFLSEVSGVSVAVGPRLANVPFTSSFRWTPVAQALKRFATNVGGTYEVAAGTVYLRAPQP
jgi:hypothetical protein